MPDQPQSGLVGLHRLLQRKELAFVLVGGVNTAFGLAMFALLFSLFGDTLHYLGALVLAYALSIVLAFNLHRRLVFRVRGNVLVDLLRFSAVQAAGFALNAVLLTAFVELLSIPVLISQTLALGLVVVGSYFAHLMFSFRRPPAESGSQDSRVDSGTGR